MRTYTEFAKSKGFDPENRRRLIGMHLQEGSKKVCTGDNFEAIVVNEDAEDSYMLSLDYFNSTLREGEKKRIFFKARWEDEEQFPEEETSELKEEMKEEYKKLDCSCTHCQGFSDVILYKERIKLCSSCYNKIK